MENVDDILPLTPVQEGILFHSLERPDSLVYIEQVTLRFHGGLDHTSLVRAISHLVHRHAALRSSILWEELERPVQVIHTNMDCTVAELDAGREPEAAFEKFLTEDRARSFDLRKGPLVRFALISFTQAYWRLVISFHHIIADGWSVLLLIRELGQHYRADINEEPFRLSQPPAFSTYIDWLAAQPQDAAETFWQEYLQGFHSPTRLSVAPPERVRDGVHMRVDQRIPVPGPVVSSLQDVARHNRVTVNTIIQLAWSLVLSRYCGESDVVFGTTFAGRPPEITGVEEMVGLFIQTAPTRVILDSTQTVSVLLSQLHSEQLSLAEHAHSGLACIQKWSEVRADEPLFETLLVFESMPVDGDIDFGNAHLEGFEFRERSNYPLALLVLPGSEWQLQIIADGRFFPATLVERMIANVLQALTILGHIETGTLTGELDVLSAVDRDLQTQWGTGEPNSPPVSTWLQIFSNVVATNASKRALQCGEQSWNYAELNSEITRRACALIDAGVQAGDRVGIEASRDASAILSILAIVLARAVYVPIDVAQPLVRRTRIAEEAGLRWVLSGSLSEGIDLPTVDLENIVVDPVHRELPPPMPEDPAYVIHTSGSTGTPRGVEVSHGNLMYSTWARKLVYDQAPDTFLLLSSPAFDSSVAGIFWTLASGGTLVLPESERTEELQHLLDCVGSMNVSHLLCVPSLWQLMLRANYGQLNLLRVAIVAGEACPVSLARTHQQNLPETHLYNEYGPTEASVWCTVERVRVPPRARTVPIGRPVPGVQLRIADENGRLAPAGVAGELLISGPTVARSYVNREPETVLAFTADIPCSDGVRVYKTGDKVRWLEGGSLEYIGRYDGQVKLHGRRIETAEIEAVLGRHPRVREVAVVLSESPAAVPTTEQIALALEAMDPVQAEAMLSEVEKKPAAETHRKTGPGYVSNLQLDSSMIQPPRDSQRHWLLGQLQREFGHEIEHLNQVATKFVRGSDIFLQGAGDISGLDLEGDDIMEDWQQPILEAMSDAVTASHGHVLEIGFGRGISATMIQERAVYAHTLIEVNEHCIRRYFEPWRQEYADRDIRIVQDTWQNAMSRLGKFDGIFFHTAARSMEEFAQATLDQITYAEQFFDTAAEHLFPGGVFTYLSNEIDSLGRAHQRRLLEHFSSFSVRRVDNLRIPEDTRDAWWAPSMVVISAVK